MRRDVPRKIALVVFLGLAPACKSPPNIAPDRLQHTDDPHTGTPRNVAPAPMVTDLPNTPFVDAGVSGDASAYSQPVPAAGAVDPRFVPQSDGGDAMIKRWATRSYSIAVVTCLAREFVPDAGEPGVYTNVSFSIDSSVRGTPPLTVSVPGGELNGNPVIISHMPRFTVGQKYLVFFARNEIGPIALHAIELDASGQFQLLGREYSIAAVAAIDTNTAVPQ